MVYNNAAIASLPPTARIFSGNLIETVSQMSDNSVDMVLTTMPFRLHSYFGADDPLNAHYPIDELDNVVKHIYRVLKEGATCFQFYNKFRGNEYGHSFYRAGFMSTLAPAGLYSIDVYEDETNPYQRSNAWRKEGGGFPYTSVSGCFANEPQPLKSLGQLVESYTEPGDMVFDPFSDSSKTREAVLMAGRNFIGCDPETRNIQTNGVP